MVHNLPGTFAFSNFYVFHSTLTSISDGLVFYNIFQLSKDDRLEALLPRNSPKYIPHIEQFTAIHWSYDWFWRVQSSEEEKKFLCASTMWTFLRNCSRSMNKNLRLRVAAHYKKSIEEEGNCDLLCSFNIIFRKWGAGVVGRLEFFRKFIWFGSWTLP